MKANATQWILASACAAMIAATAHAAPPYPRDSRHPDPRGRGEYSRHHRPPPNNYCRPPPPRYHSTYNPPPVYWGYYPPPPPPMVYYPPPPVIYYPYRPGFNFVFSF